MSSGMTEDVELELRGRVTALEELTDQQRQAISFLLLAAIATAVGMLALTHHLKGLT